MGLFKRKRRRNRKHRKPVERVSEIGGHLVRGAIKVWPWVLLASLLMGLWFLIDAGWESGLRVDLFLVDDVQVKGLTKTQEQEVLEAIEYEAGSTYLFAMDLKKASREVEALPWIATAEVHRAMPGTLRIEVTERQLAGVAMIGRLTLLDTEGVPFKPVEGESLMDAPVVTGLGDVAHLLDEADFARAREALQIASLYKKHDLDRFDRLSEVEIDENLGYTLVTETRGIQVALGEGRMDERMERLGEVFVQLRQKNLKPSRIMLDGERSLDKVVLGFEEVATR